MSAKSTLVLSLAVVFVALILLGFDDKLRHQPTCKSVATGQIDTCAKTGGLSK